MDDIDRRLLALLRHDASRPLKTLASEVALSRSSVRDRIARLQALGIIRRYTIEVAEPETSVRALLLVRLQRTPDPAFVAHAVAHPLVVRCYSLSGDIDLMLEVVAADVAELNDTRDALSRFPAVVEIVTTLVLKRDKTG